MPEHRPQIGPQAFLLRPGVVAAAAALVTAIGYGVQGGRDGVAAREVFVIVMLVAAATTGVAGAAVSDRLASASASAWAAGTLIAIGSISLPTIGVPLLLAGAIAVAPMLGNLGHGAPRAHVLRVALILVAAFVTVFSGILLTR